MELGEFLIDISEDPDKVTALKERPHEVMEEAGLSQEDKDLLLGGDPAALQGAVRGALEGSSRSGMAAIVLVLIFV